MARIGGEEFGLVLPGATEGDARCVAIRVQDQMREMGLAVTASGGVAVSPTDGTTRTDLMRAADKALYAAKGAGRNRIICATSLRRRASAGTEAVAARGIVQNG